MSVLRLTYSSHLIYELAAHEKVYKWREELELYQYNIDIVI